MDKIIFAYTKNERISNIINKNKEEIKKEILAKDIVETEIEGYSKEWNINGETVKFIVKK